VGELCGWLAERGVPLLLWHVEVDWAALHALAAAFPRLAIVVETQNQKVLYQDRALFALMRDCPNVHVETSNLAGADFLGFAARELGARRLLFGSFAPVNDPWAAIGMILDADLPWEDKRLIAGGNLRRLLGEARG
jgi:predicted TIM-barrel fold metal-dependent hydrolase